MTRCGGACRKQLTSVTRRLQTMSSAHCNESFPPAVYKETPTPALRCLLPLLSHIIGIPHSSHCFHRSESRECHQTNSDVCNGDRRLLLENDCDSQRIERNTFWENPINCIQGSSVLPVEHYDSVELYLRRGSTYYHYVRYYVMFTLKQLTFNSIDNSNCEIALFQTEVVFREGLINVIIFKCIEVL